MRNPRKSEPKEGETLYMYTGLRSNKCRLIRKDLTLKSSQDIVINIDKSPDLLTHKFHLSILIDGRPLSTKQINEFCLNDGFENEYDLIDWFERRNNKEFRKFISFQFVGKLYHWTDFKY